jgi:hypothetical protein
MLFLLIASILVTTLTQIFALRFAAGVVMLVVIVAAVVSLFRIPCPNCHRPLGRAGFWGANAGKGSVSGRCPHCGISFDEPMPEKG